MRPRPGIDRGLPYGRSRSASSRTRPEKPAGFDTWKGHARCIVAQIIDHTANAANQSQPRQPQKARSQISARPAPTRRPMLVYINYMQQQKSIKTSKISKKVFLSCLTGYNSRILQIKDDAQKTGFTRLLRSTGFCKFRIYIRHLTLDMLERGKQFRTQHG